VGEFQDSYGSEGAELQCDLNLLKSTANPVLELNRAWFPLLFLKGERVTFLVSCTWGWSPVVVAQVYLVPSGPLWLDNCIEN